MTQRYATVTPRIGKIKAAMLKAALPVMTLDITGEQHQIGKNQSDTMVFRRWLPFGGATTNSTTINQWSVDENAHLVQEGVTPEADTVQAQDITVQLNQYACLYSYSDKTAELYEDNIPDYMKMEAGERMGLVREMIRYGTLKGGTNKFYAGGTSRATVDETVGLNILSNVTRSLLGNRCKLITSVLEASGKYNTTPVEPGFLVFTHVDMEHDIRNIPGFKQVVEYGTRKQVHDMELGSTNRYRFIVSPELNPIIDAGASVTGTGLKSTGGSNIDIYPMIVVAARAWANVALRGADSMKIIHIPHTHVDKVDPLQLRGYIGNKFWDAAFVQNDGWMAVIECGATDL